jgi:hypothetical protein
MDFDRSGQPILFKSFQLKALGIKIDASCQPHEHIERRENKLKVFSIFNML